MQMKVAFVGNPNCGKTSLFNAYTGAKHKVGNWPGVTVEKKEGVIKHDGYQITLVDLPGIYSISPYSLEEILTREYILEEEPDVVVNIVNATNLERNLYLTLQLIELSKPVVVALNMMDIVENRGYVIDIDKLSQELGVPVIPISATRRRGLKRLVHKMIYVTKKRHEYRPITIEYNDEIEEKIVNTKSIINEQLSVSEDISRWYALKVLEKDSEIIKKLDGIEVDEASYEEEIANRKYQFISEFIGDVVSNVDENEHSITDKIDKVVTHNIFGVPIFLGIMALVFAFTFTVGNFLADYFDQGFSLLSDLIRNALIAGGVAEWVISLVVDGAIGGVGGVLIFLPNIACLFFAISLLEDSGYMSRVALLMDKLMRKIGLSGKAFIPMILGFGCSVPAIMTARTLEDERKKLVTILITPFMSCSAKIPIYVLFSRVFFPGHEILISFSLYILGVLIAILAAIGFKIGMKSEDNSPLIMEFPDYKRPAAKTTFIFVFEKVKDYLLRAGTVIFFASIVLWFILEFNFTGKVDMTESFGASIGKFIAPIFAPLGFGNWQAALALIAGIMGKEIVVSSMAVIYSITETGFAASLLAAGFTGLSAYAFMVFCLLYTPCIATLGVIKKETNSYKWTIFSLVYQIMIAWTVSFIIYQVGSLFV